MATAVRPNQRVAPKAAPKAEVPAAPTPIKASFFTRVKTTIVKTAKRVVSFVKTQARKVRFVALVIKARVTPIAKRAWTVAVRPYLGGVLAGAALFTVVAGAFLAPFTFSLALIVAGLAFIFAARGVRLLENSDTRGARIALNVLETIGQVLRTAMYATAALLAIVLCVASPLFAVYTTLTLVLTYLDVRGAGTIAFLAWCVLSGSWALGLVWLLWRGATRVTVEQAEVIDVPAYSEIRIRPLEHAHVLRARTVTPGTEEVEDILDADIVDEPYVNEIACGSCGTHDGMIRVRSNDVRFELPSRTLGTYTVLHAENALLCEVCYEAECEDNAIALTGVSLAQRSVNVVLNVMGRSRLPEVSLSKQDLTQVFWATTAWWRDRKGHHHERQWDCFHDGKIVANVTYDHKRKVYRASAHDKFIATKTGLGVAKRLATDSLFDEINATSQAIDTAVIQMVETHNEQAR